MSASSLRLAVTHLNAPVGEVLTIEELAHALRSGSVSGLSKRSAALVSYMFVELEPSLIAGCATEIGSNLRHVNLLYEESIETRAPRVPRWEQAVEHLL